jgi:hypothetical protein
LTASSPTFSTTRKPSPTRTTVIFILVQLLPLALLGIVYTRVSTVLAVTDLNGVSLQNLLLASAVAGPLLGQTVSGPIFRSLEGVSTSRLAALAAINLRNFPKAMMVSAPAVILADVGLAYADHLAVPGALGLAGVLEVHLIFAGSLVPAFAKRSASMIAVAWLAYGSALFFFPTYWWAPAASGLASQLLIQVIASRLRLRGVRTASSAAMLHGLVKGLAQATPLWALPVAVFVRDPGAISPSVVFAVLVPALLVYHFYFSTVAGPLWKALDGIRTALASAPYVDAKAQITRVAHTARRGEFRITTLVVALALFIVPYGLSGESAASYFVVSLFSASALAVILTVQLCRLSMLREGVGTYVAAAIVAANLGLAVALGLSEVDLLLEQSLVTALLITGVSFANRVVWRLPEYTLFWRTALRQ